MKIGFLILAHNTPDQLQRLVASLRHKDHVFFVHIDRKSDIGPFLGAEADDVLFRPKRRKVFWGDFSPSQVTLDMIETALSFRPTLDYLVLLSGSDYAIDTADNVNAFFRDNQGKQFIDCQAMPSEGKPFSRLEDYHVSTGLPGIAGLYHRARSRLGLGPIKRDFQRALGGAKPHGGSQWWALSRPAASHVHGFAASHPRLHAFFKGTFIPDECYFATIIANSPFAGAVAQSLTYTDWSKGGPHPAIIGERHLTFLETRTGPAARARGERPFLFARKFTDDAVELTARIDGLARRRPPLEPTVPAVSS